MNTKLVNSTAGVINAALTQNHTAAGIALALESAGLLMGPDTAAELARLRAEHAVPRTERSYWDDIATALNAALAVGMSVGVDLDGTLTDHNAWSVVWDQAAERWAVSGYEEQPADPRACKSCGSLPEQWCPDCGACRKGCYDGLKNNLCAHAGWGDAS